MFFSTLACIMYGSMLAEIGLEIIRYQPSTIESLFPFMLKAGACVLFNYFV